MSERVCFLLLLSVVRIGFLRFEMASTSETIKLMIRTANNQHADFELELPLAATVYDLKQQITVNHPTKSVSSQIDR